MELMEKVVVKDVRKILQMYLRLAKDRGRMRFADMEQIVEFTKKRGSGECWLTTIALFERCWLLPSDDALPELLQGLKNDITTTGLSALFIGDSPVRVSPDGQGNIRQISPLSAEVKGEMLSLLEQFRNCSLTFNHFKRRLGDVVEGLPNNSEFHHAIKLANALPHDKLSAFFLERAMGLLPKYVLASSEFQEMFRDLSLTFELLENVPPDDGLLFPNAQVSPGLSRQLEALEDRRLKEADDYQILAKKFLEERGIPRYRKMGEASFSHLIGMTEQKAHQLIEPFVNGLYVAEGETTTMHTVIMLAGAPGTGKSYAMMALANEINATIMLMKAESILDQYIGNSEKHFVKFVESAIKKHAETGRLSLILIDEAEIMVPTKDQDNRKSAEDILPLFNSFTSGPRKYQIEGKVVFVLTVNNMRVVDPTVISRAHIINFTPPTREEVEQLLIQHTVGKGMRCQLGKIAWKRLAEMSDGLVPRDVEHVSRMAKTFSLARCAKDLDVSLIAADDEHRAQIASSYRITHRDLEKAVIAVKSKVTPMYSSIMHG